MGINLPSDYKELVSQYSPGVFDDFIHILTPNAPTSYVDLDSRRSDPSTDLPYLSEMGEEIPEEIPDVSYLLPAAITDNGDYCYWLTIADCES